MTTPIGVRVLLDGEPVAETSSAFNAGTTTVLTGLKLDWGRDTTIDQPKAAAVSFKLAQRAGRADFLTALRVGRRIDVEAFGILYTDPTKTTIIDPGFEDAAAGSIPPVLASNATITVTDAIAATGDHSAALIAADAGRPITATFAPAPFSDSPAAWDTIAATNPNAQWSFGATVHAPAGATISVQPALFAKPDGSSVTIDDTTLTATADGTWQTLTGDFFADRRGAWVGVAVTIDGISSSWAAAAGTWLDHPEAWLDHQVAYVDDLVALAPSGGTIRTVSVFAGRITDQDAHWDRQLAAGTLIVECSTRDFTSDLDNDRIGDDPWPVQTIQERTDRILELASTTFDSTIDASIADTLVSYRDVDSQAAGGLIRELAASVGGVAWSAIHATEGPYYWIEDPGNRPALLVLDMGDDGLVEIMPSAAAGDAIALTAANILEAPIHWVQNVSDLSTRVDVTWLEQGVDDDGNPETTERHVLVVDADLELEFGQRGISLSTQLQDADDAQAVATRLLARTSESDWHLEDVTWDIGLEASLSLAEVTAALDLLDGTIRNGHALAISGMPAWSPGGSLIGVYIEGGSYTFDNGAWSLAMTVSSAGSEGESIAWVAADPDWRWIDMDPSLAWTDLFGVGAPTTEAA